MISGVIYTRTRSIQDNLNIVSPRITSSIQSKYLKREDYNKSPEFNLDDKYIIAINTHHINHRDLRGKAIEYFLYGIGLQWIKQNGESEWYVHSKTPKQNKDGIIVDLEIATFFREEYKDLAAIITSSN